MQYRKFGKFMQKSTIVFCRLILGFSGILLTLITLGCGDAADTDHRDFPQYFPDGDNTLGPIWKSPDGQRPPLPGQLPNPSDPNHSEGSIGWNIPDSPGKPGGSSAWPGGVNTPEQGATERPNPNPGEPPEDSSNPPKPEPEPDPTPDPDPDPSTPEPAPDAREFLDQIGTRAMWIWDETPGARDILENRGGARDELLEFAAAPHGDANRKLNRFFFEARGHSNSDRFAQLRDISYDPLTDSSAAKDLRRFLKKAHAQGIAVEYLDGQAIWLATEQLAEHPRQICRDVVAFNLATDQPEERLDGVHLDIEPHTVHSGPWAGQWWENRLPEGYNADWTRRWKEIMNDCRATFDAYKAQTGHHLVLAGDVGTDYAFYNTPILEFFNGADSPIDYLGIMNYYDNRPNIDGLPSFFHGDHDGDNMVGGVEQNLQMWHRIPLLFGIETGSPSIAPDEASFHLDGYGAMNRTIDTLVENYHDSHAIGVAIHHYSPNSYRDLSP